MRRKREISNVELKRKYTQWMRNFMCGIRELVDVDKKTQHYIFFVLCQECLFNQTTTPFFLEMYKRDDFFYKKDTDCGLEDYQIAPHHRKQLMEGLQDLIVGGGRKKFLNILQGLE